MKTVEELNVLCKVYARIVNNLFKHTPQAPFNDEQNGF